MILAFMSTPHAVSSFAANQNLSILIGPMIYGGAPYSAIGVTEFCVLRSALKLSCLKMFDPIP